MSSPRRPWIDRLADRALWVTPTPGRFSRIGRACVRAIGPLLRLLFRPRLLGTERLPSDRPFLVVANHSGGGATECLCLAWLWQERFGDTRPVAGMATPAAFLLPDLAWVLRGLGAVPATYRHAEAAFAAGASVLVFPGGDFDGFRPIWKANEVDFHGRKGYLRLARKVGVPIVPMGIRGSHYCAPILWRSRLLPWVLVVPRLLFGAKRLPITLLGVLGAALLLALAGPAWGYPVAAGLAVLWLTCPFSFAIPIVPWTIEARLGPALAPEDLFRAGTDEAVLEDAGRRVVREIERLVREP